NAPSPRRAHQRRPRAGAETNASETSPSRSSASSVAHTGTPRTYDIVPSIGSTIHFVSPPSSPNSSPKTLSPRPDEATSSRIACSASRSASETGVRSGFVSTRRSSARNRRSVTASAASARAPAKRRSASKLRLQPQAGGEHERVVAGTADELHRRRQPVLRRACRKRECRPSECVERIGEADERAALADLVDVHRRRHEPECRREQQPAIAQRLLRLVAQLLAPARRRVDLRI